MKSHLNRKSRAWWYAPVISATVGSINKRTAVQAGGGKKQDSISKIIKAKKGWGCGSSNRVPIKQV
jgi:hypothetical protein